MKPENFTTLSKLELEAMAKALPHLSKQEKLELFADLDLRESRANLQAAKTNMLGFAQAVYPGFKIGPHHKKLAKIFTDVERKQVEAMSGYGLPIEQIAILIRDGIDADTLRKHFVQELMRGKAKANAQIGKTLFQKAMSGDTTAAIWWSKTQMKWKEVQQHELVGDNGGALTVVIKRFSDD